MKLSSLQKNLSTVHDWKRWKGQTLTWIILRKDFSVEKYYLEKKRHMYIQWWGNCLVEKTNSIKTLAAFQKRHNWIQVQDRRKKSSQEPSGGEQICWVEQRWSQVGERKDFAAIFMARQSRLIFQNNLNIGENCKLKTVCYNVPYKPISSLEWTMPFLY